MASNVFHSSAIMKAGNCDQCAYRDRPSAASTHFLPRHDDSTEVVLPWEAGDFPTVGPRSYQVTRWMRMPLLVISCCSARLKAGRCFGRPYTPFIDSTADARGEPMLMIVPVPRLRRQGGA